MMNLMRRNAVEETSLPQLRRSEMKLGLTSPSNNVVYGASLLSILLSLFLVRKNPTLANFTGLWAPTILGLGIFLKENRLLETENRLLRQRMGLI